MSGALRLVGVVALGAALGGCASTRAGLRLPFDYTRLLETASAAHGCPPDRIHVLLDEPRGVGVIRDSHYLLDVCGTQQDYWRAGEQYGEGLEFIDDPGDDAP